MQLSPSVLKAYQRRLTNLTSRNRSLLLTSLPGEQFLDLHETDFLLSQPSFDLIRQLIARKAAIPLCDVLDPRLEKGNEVSKKLRRIARTERFIDEERGAKDLYVAWPFVRGKFNDGTVTHAPLVFFPVTLEQRGNRWTLVRRPDESVLLNRSFLLAYAFYNQIRLPDDWLERTLDEFAADPTPFRTQLYELLKDSPLEINFNTELFEDKLRWFDKLTKSDLDTLERNGELRLCSEAVLGIFPQAGSYLVPDYDVLVEQGAGGMELRAEGVGPGADVEVTPALSPLPLAHIREKHIHTPLPLDASQEEALRKVKGGASLVVQGPPGTGKSQLIGNLMADFAAQGKRVLLVCQKRAALDVVYERLRGVGMAPFTALIHDFKNDRRALYDGLAWQIDRVEDYRRQNLALDAILLERTFDQQCHRIDQTLTELQAFRDALFDETHFGTSVKELYLSSNPKVDSVPMDDVYRHFRKPEAEAFAEKLRQYEAYQQRLGQEHPWQNRVSFARFALSDQRAIRQTIGDVTQTAAKLALESQRLFGMPIGWRQARQLTVDLAYIRTIPDGVADPTVWTLLRRCADPATRTGEPQLRQVLNDVRQAFAQQPPRIGHAPAELPLIAQRLQAGINARSSFFNWLFYKDKAYVRDLASRHQFTDSLDDLHRLKQHIEHQQQWYGQLDDLTRQLGLPPLTDANPTRTQQAVADLDVAFRQAADLWQFIQFRMPFLTAWLARTDKRLVFQEGLWQLTAWLQEAAEKSGNWEKYLTPEQIDALTQPSDATAPALLLSLDRDFDLMLEADRLLESFPETEKLVLDRLMAHSQRDWPALFDNSLRLAWIEHIEAQHPELRSVSSLKMSQLEKDLQEGVLKKQELSQQILLTQLREQTYKKLEYNRLNNLITYRDLNHQVTKKRNVWPIRKLMEAFADEVFRLVPCWMASPESVSAIFPMEPDLFDLVIFDEASQCYAENGIPALYRARQVVVTGDSRQLQPSDLYRIRYEEQTDDPTPELEIESLLDLAAHRFPQTYLRGHYRSQSPELIEFSNRQFYRRKLHLLPDFHHLNRREPAIRYLHVDGIWQNYTNETEARAVVDLIGQLQQQLPDHSVGVVTFNFPQQQLIQEMLETETPLPDGLFVKNIENVQGDERDVIIFSVGYAPDSRGRISAQFGSLNAKGGENRLNVAVTRARERIYVVTSLWPYQLPVENTLNEGPKLLRDYLAFAQDVSEGRYQPTPFVTERLPGYYLLKDRLADPAAGLVEELPFADLTRKEGEHYKELVLTDDALYYESTPKDAHAYTPLLLRRRHWPFERIYSREWWRKG